MAHEIDDALRQAALLWHDAYISRNGRTRRATPYNQRDRSLSDGVAHPETVVRVAPPHATPALVCGPSHVKSTRPHAGSYYVGDNTRMRQPDGGGDG